MVYLDHAATTPLIPEAREAWLRTQDLLGQTPGNPSALHSGGRTAARIVEDSRQTIADALGAERVEVVFTSGATEANALGVLGAARAVRSDQKNTVLISAVEHDSVKNLAAAGPDLNWETMGVNHDGTTIIPTIDDTVALASLSMVCAETGVIQPVTELVNSAPTALVHTDAAQALGHLPIDFKALGVDLLTLGGHKIGAPVGTGALLVKRGVKIKSDRPGGGQERKLRSGTVDAAGAAALAAAVHHAVRHTDEMAQRHQQLKNRLLRSLPPEVTQTTPAPSSTGIAHLTLPTSHPEILLLAMDAAGIMVSAGSACHAGVTRPSQILLEMGRSEQGALGVLRVSFGSDTTEQDIDEFANALPAALTAARAMDNRG